MASSLDENSFKSLKNANHDEIIQLTNNLSNDELNGVVKIIRGGIDNFSKLKEVKEVKSLSEFKQLININKEYANIEAKIKGIVKDKKAYKKLHKANAQLEKVEKIDIKNISNDPKTLLSTAKDMELLSPAMQLFQSFRVIDFGFVFPFYNRLMLNGIRNKGVNIEIAPKNFYVGVTSGKTENILSPNQPNDSLFLNETKQINAFKFGYGEKFENHIHVNYLYASDNSLFDISGLKQVNHVVGIDFLYTLLNKINIVGEYNYSILNSTDFNSSLSSKLNGHALFLRPSLLLKNGGELYSFIEVIDKKYNTFGLPYFINGRKTYEVGVNLPLFKNQILVNTSIKKDIINNPLFNNSNSNIYNIIVHFKKEKLPYISVNYALADITNSIEIGKSTRNSVQQLGIVSGYLYNLNNIKFNTQISFNLNNSYLINNTAFLDEGNINISYLTANNLKNRSVSITQQMQLNKISLGTTGSLTSFYAVEEEKSYLYTIENNINIPLFKNKVNTQLAFIYGKQENDSKIGYSMAITYLINRNLNFMFNLRNDFLNVQHIENSGTLKGLTLFGQLNINF
jgi:hypothetical protein